MKVLRMKLGTETPRSLAGREYVNVVSGGVFTEDDMSNMDAESYPVYSTEEEAWVEFLNAWEKYRSGSPEKAVVVWRIVPSMGKWEAGYRVWSRVVLEK